ncbi:MAG TPA: CehA/McbA family metallohydrolase [Chloroflexota bacterium]
MTSDVYRPVDLSAYCNAGPDLLGDHGAEVPLGRQHFQGLPFQIGTADQAFIAPSESPITVAIDAVAYTVVVAHRLIGSEIYNGGPVGLPVADYVFHLADGTTHEIPIRERFEIAELAEWGQLPFTAVADQKHATLSRWTGDWSGTGYRQTEVATGSPKAYYLWCWTNPTPDVAVKSLELRPRGPAARAGARLGAPGPRFIVAAITLGLSNEHPFVREGAVPVRIDLTSQTVSARDLRMDVDRGVAGYTYQLPVPSAEDYGFAGWGEAANPAASPAYAHVAAIPSATLAIKHADTTLGEVRWGDLLERRTVATNDVRVQIVEDGRNWVETVVVDDATNQLVPCRIHFRSTHGVPYQPHGHHSHIFSDMDTWHIDVGGDLRLGQATYAYIDGRCAGWLPRGEVIVDVARGYEYEPLRQRVTIAPGQQRLELRLRRWANMNQQRWFSGDTHVHFLSTQGSLREAQSEDLNVVNLLQSQWGSLFTSTEEFTGAPAISRDGRTIVWANQENRQHFMGHMILLGLRQPVYPWCSDGPSEAELGGTMETTLSAWADACHAQDGTVILPHFPNPNGEPATLIATGRIDAVEMIRNAAYNHAQYYRYLNTGYRLPLVGGTDKMSSGVAVGQYRTYVYIPQDEDFTYSSWCQGLKAGRTFLSGGPLLELSVEGAQIGDTVSLPAAGGTVEVSTTARSTIPIHTLQIVQNGQVVAQTDSDSPAGSRSLTLRSRVRVTEHSWLAARVGGPNYQQLSHHDVWQRGVFAHTSPIYVACGSDSWSRHDPEGLHYMQTLVEGSLEYIRHIAPHDRSAATTHHHGEPDHQAYLERPFHQALAALQARLRH